MKLNNKIEEYEEEVSCLLEENGYTLVKFTIIRQKTINFKIIIDCTGGISHKDCQKVTSLISEFLETKNIPTNFGIEVSSPGIHRELKSLRELKAFLGRRILVSYLSQGKLLQETGLLQDASPEKVMLLTEAQEKTFSTEIIKKIQLT